MLLIVVINKFYDYLFIRCQLQLNLIIQLLYLNLGSWTHFFLPEQNKNIYDYYQYNLSKQINLKPVLG